MPLRSFLLLRLLEARLNYLTEHLLYLIDRELFRELHERMIISVTQVTLSISNLTFAISTFSIFK